MEHDLLWRSKVKTPLQRLRPTVRYSKTSRLDQQTNMKKNIISKFIFATLCLAVTPSVLLADVVPPPSVPDSGSSVVLLTIGVAGLFAARRFLGKANR